MKNDQNSNLKFDRKGVAFKVAQQPISVTVLGVYYSLEILKLNI